MKTPLIDFYFPTNPKSEIWGLFGEEDWNEPIIIRYYPQRHD